MFLPVMPASAAVDRLFVVYLPMRRIWHLRKTRMRPTRSSVTRIVNTIFRATTTAPRIVSTLPGVVSGRT
jgi:hypothetical protein